MKEYEKEYENYFTNEELSSKRCKMEDVGVTDGIVLDEYAGKMRKEIIDFQKSIFDHLVKIAWLTRKFTYKGQKRTFERGDGYAERGGSSSEAHRAFTVFLRNYIKCERYLLFGGRELSHICSYFDSFFPDFDSSNPFLATYVYPYQHMTLECLLLVRKMPERMELLAIGEARGMDYPRFGDYVFNYALCYNEEHGDTYALSPYCVDIVKKYEET